MQAIDLPPEFRRPELFRLARQRLIAEKLDGAAALAEEEGHTREAHELREQAAHARLIAAEALRGLAVG